MVMSIRSNLFFKNDKRSIVHALYLNLISVELSKYAAWEGHITHSKDAFIADIQQNIKITPQSLARPTYERYRVDPYSKKFPTA